MIFKKLKVLISGGIFCVWYLEYRFLNRLINSFKTTQYMKVGLTKASYSIKKKKSRKNPIIKNIASENRFELIIFIDFGSYNKKEKKKRNIFVIGY